MSLHPVVSPLLMEAAPSDTHHVDGPAHPTELGHLISLDHPTIYSWDLLEGIEKFFQFLPNNKLV